MKRLWILCLTLLGALTLAACGDGSSGSTTASFSLVAATPTPTPTPTAVANVASVVLDAGPAALNAGSNAYTAFNQPYVTITVCAPGSTSNCQTIDHVILDTGSVGLRIIQPVLNAALLGALPTESDASGNPVGECYQYVNSYVFGSIRKLDFTIAGETVANMPVHVIGDTGTFATVPASCSAGGGTDVKTVQDFGGNAILGVGTTTTDCGSYCTVVGGSSAATYYDCPSTGCSAVISRAANTSAPFEQVPNPVAAFATDNNGTIISLPSVPQRGAASLTGTLTFGIGTQADNVLTAPNLLMLTTSASRLGPGVLTATYNGSQLTQSFLDSGSNDYFFIDTSLPACTQADLAAFYCPVGSVALSPLLTGADGATASGAFILYSPLDVSSSATVAPGLGINPTLVSPPLPFSNSFDFGLPFFFGKTVYTAIEGRQAGNVQGPYVGF